MTRLSASIVWCTLYLSCRGVPCFWAKVASGSVRLDLDYQFWTSRGFAVVDVDYRGSTGYGRAYRNELLGAWGIVDLDDCTNAAVWLAEQGLVDPQRLAIRGGSAGGYTTLAALAFH